MKLIVKPREGLRKGRYFTVRVRYSGEPQLIVDTDTSIEGWIQACRNPGFAPPCDGAHVVNQPIGAQSWFPSNNYPTDKAAFDTFVTVPNASTAFGIGELASRRSRGGRTTWHWREDDPTATYLTTATVGTFDYTQSSYAVGGRNLPNYTGIDSSYSPVQKQNVIGTAGAGAGDAQLPGRLVRHLPVRLDRGGRGSRAGRRLRAGGADQVALLAARQRPAKHDISDSTLLHEIAHQWVGNTVTLAQWPDIWFNEGWATWSEWIWGSEGNGEREPGRDLGRALRDHTRRGLGDRAGGAGWRSRQPVRRVPGL